MPPPAADRSSRWFSWGLLLVAVAAMGAVHVLQADFGFWHEPLSFHVHGGGGRLLPLALASFGLLLIVLRRHPERWPLRLPVSIVRFGLTAAGGLLLLAAAFPSDRWFPWERAPSLGGVLHAAAGLLAPAFLLLPMYGILLPIVGRRWWLVLYLLGAGASVISLLHAVWVDGSPRHLGVAERTLGFAAAGWCAALLLGNERRRLPLSAPGAR